MSDADVNVEVIVTPDDTEVDIPGDDITIYVDNGSTTIEFDGVGTSGAAGPAGPAGANGTNGLGVPAGGSTGQVLTKQSNADNDTFWAAASGGVASVFGRIGAILAVAGDYTAAKITNVAAGGIAATDVQAAINELDTEKANLASPTFTGNPLAPTPAAGDADTSIATTAFVDTSFVKTPATNTANNVPQWNGANSKTLKDGLGVGTGANQLVQLDGSSKLPAVDGSQLTNISSGIPSGYIYNLTLSNNGSDLVNDIDIATGSAINSANTQLMTLASVMTKQLDVAWAVGTNQGMRATGAAIANTTYHIFLIRRPDTGVVDIAADTSVSGANIASNTNVNYTQIRRIGSIVRSGGTIVAFTQNGNEFLWSVPIQDINGAATSTTGALVTLSVPTGIQVGAIFTGRFNWTGAGNYILLTSPDQANTAPALTAFNVVLNGTVTSMDTQIKTIRTNTSAQIRQRSDSATINYYIITHGWVDTRDATVISGASVLTSSTVPNYLTGLVMSNNGGSPTTHLDIAAGTAADSTNAALMTLVAMTKRVDVNWVVGTNQGGLDTGAVANGTYHVFVISGPGGTPVDALFSTSPTAPTMPVGYTLFRRIGSIIRSGGAILAFSQAGNTFLLNAMVANLAAVAPGGTTAISQAVTTPAGIKTTALLRVRQDDTGGGVATLFTSLDESDQAPASGLTSVTTSASLPIATVALEVRTNTSSQIRIRSNGTTCTRSLTTYGWIDERDNFSMSGGSHPDLVTSKPQGRLTLQSLVPVMVTTQSAKTTLIYTAYNGNQCPIYNGSTFSMRSFGTEISVLTTDTTKSPAAIGASKVNDWFIWDDAGTLRLGHGPDWTSDTVRSAGTALVMVNGILLNAVALTNGPAIQRGTYVGTTRSNGSSQLDWILGTSAALGGMASLYVWNAYNRVVVSTRVGDSTASWAYGTTTVRAANASNANRVNFISGLQEDAFQSVYLTLPSGAGATSILAGIGFDSTTVFTGNTGWLVVAAGLGGNVIGNFQSTTLGAHFVQALEWVNAATTFNGDGSSAGLLLTGLNFTFQM